MTADASKKPRLKPWVKRLIVAHVLAYPLAMVFAAACIPLAVVGLPDDAVREESVGDLVLLVLEKIHWPAYAVLALQHVVALPWMLAKTSTRLWARVFWLATGLLFAANIAFAVVTWARFLATTNGKG